MSEESIDFRPHDRLRILFVSKGIAELRVESLMTEHGAMAVVEEDKEQGRWRGWFKNKGDIFLTIWTMADPESWFDSIPTRKQIKDGAHLWGDEKPYEAPPEGLEKNIEWGEW